MGILTSTAARLAIASLALVCATAWADPPTRAIRIASVSGAVSFLPSGEADWVQTRINRPVWTGDRLWIDRGARAELQLGGAALFVGPQSSVAVLDYDDDRAQFEVTQGRVDVYVRSLGANDAIEIDTPNLAFVIRRAGEYRIDVRPDGESTAVAVVRGEGEAFGAQSAYTLRAGQGFRFFGADLADYDAEPRPPASAFDTWVASRVQRYERSASARYVSQDMVGYADLDAYGTWRNDATYGAVWVPTRVDAQWAPYRYGHWNWVDPWGWTWIDDAPWGFAPFHYGRWAYVDNRYWGWVPGPRNAPPVYAPAVVGFVAGESLRASAAGGPGVAWFPLAPGEVYRPAYNASRDYFTRVNVTNTVVNVTVVTNVYNNPRATDVRYVNVSNANAVTVVPTQAFVQAQPVQRAAVRMDRGALQATQVVAGAPVAPARASVTGAAAPAQARPDQRTMDRKVMARQAPPAAPASFERREEALKQQPGKPLERGDAARGAPARTNVTVVQAAAVQPIPAAPPGERGKGRERNPPETAKASAPQVAQPAPPPPTERGRGNAARAQPEHPQPAAKVPEPARPSVAAPPPASPPQVAQPAPTPPAERARGNAARAQPEHPQPAAKAPEPARPGVAAPPPAPPAAKSPEPARPAQAAPAPAPQDNKQGKGKHDDDGAPGQKGRGRD